jgi:magnesium chelatase subunit D
VTTTVSPTASPEDVSGGEPVLRSDMEQRFPPALLPADPYPEDTAPVAREADSLQLPPKSARSMGSNQGPIIGTQRATRMQDIALLSTLLEAARYQKVRDRERGEAARKLGKADSPRLQLRRADLRSYRRAPIPQNMLVLLLDYTCLRTCNWKDAVLPHLSWAYVTRASMSVVQVGGFGAQSRQPLRAEQVTARGLLSPRIGAVLKEKPGAATPLAHGLDLVARTLRATLQHGRNQVQKARLVVVSDGRGNVPLAASYAGELTHPVTREGIEDALRTAREIRHLKRVEAFLLDPQPKPYAELPTRLAEALGATVQKIAPLAQEKP